MNRKEEIEKYARECAANQVYCIEIDITHACEWADKTMIEKACRWLKDNIDHYAYNKDFVTIEDFIKSFRKTMEE